MGAAAGRDLEFGAGSSIAVPGTRRGDELTVGAVYRNCSPAAIELGRVDFYNDLAIELQGLGRAFQFKGVVEDGGLGRPTLRGARVSWGKRVLAVEPGTQVTLTFKVKARRPGRFEFGSHYASAGSPEGPFQSTQRGLQFGRLYAVSRHRRPDPGVVVKTCFSSDARRLARPPSARVRRPGRPRVRLRRRDEVCTRSRLHGDRAQRWSALPEVPGGSDVAPPPLADCLLSSDAVSLALNGFLVSRRDWCVPPTAIEAQVLVDGQGGERVVGTGRLGLSRRLAWDPRTSDGRYEMDVSYIGVSGVIEAGAFFRFAPRCEMAFGSSCAGPPDGSPQRTMGTGTTAHVSFDIRPGAIPGNSKDYLQPWLEANMAPTAAGLNLPNANRVVISGPRARCDTRGQGQRCVWADFTPTMTFAAPLLPEIAAHIQRAQAAGQPGGRASGRPLERLTGTDVSRNRRASCPRKLVIRFRRERPGGSCDEYPFASSAQGGAGASVANVPRRENNVQGGLLGSFYDRERVLRDDAYWVAVGP